jgi:vacuolar-type H+-ATPase catalytic subunit A/Vma1
MGRARGRGRKESGGRGGGGIAVGQAFGRGTVVVQHSAAHLADRKAETILKSAGRTSETNFSKLPRTKLETMIVQPHSPGIIQNWTL